MSFDPRARPPENRRFDILAGAAIVALVALAFSPWWAAGGFFAPLDVMHEMYEPWADGDVDVHNHFTSDAVTQYLPYRVFAERAFTLEGRVGWNDLQYLGTPAWSNTMAGYDDWTMQLHRWLDFATAWHLGLAVSLVIAGLGTYMMLRAAGLGIGASLVGGLAFAANSQFANWFFHRFQLASFCWVPWIFWAIHRGRSRSSEAWFLVPVFTALALVGGTLQTAVFVVIAVLAGAVLVEPSSRNGIREGGAVGSRLWTDALPWLALAGGLACVSLLGEVGAYLETVRSGQVRGEIGYPRGWLEPFRSSAFAAAQAAPSLLGSPRSVDLSKLLGRDLLDVAYFGTLPCVFAALALFRADAPRAGRALAATGLILPLTPLVGPLYHRVQILWILGGVWLFVWYWSVGARTAPPAFDRRLWIAWGGFLAAWAIGSLVSLGLDEELSRRIRTEVAGRVAGGAGQFGMYSAWMEERAGRLLGELRIWAPRQLAWGLGVTLGLAAFSSRSRLPRLGGFVMALAIALELGAYWQGWVTVVDPDTHPVYGERDDLDRLRRAAGKGAVIVFRGPDGLLFPPNLLAAHGIRSIEQYESIRPLGAWQRSGFTTTAEGLGTLGVSLAVTPTGTAPPTAGWLLEHSEEGFDVWRNPRALPRYMSGVERRDGRDERPVHVVTETPGRRVLRLSRGVEDVRVAENCTKDWRARLDDGPWFETSCGVDGMIRVALAPRATGRILELEYRPRLRSTGRAVGLVTIGALAALAVIRRRRSRGSVKVAQDGRK